MSRRPTAAPKQTARRTSSTRMGLSDADIDSTPSTIINNDDSMTDLPQTIPTTTTTTTTTTATTNTHDTTSTPATREKLIKRTTTTQPPPPTESIPQQLRHMNPNITMGDQDDDDDDLFSPATTTTTTTKRKNMSSGHDFNSQLSQQQQPISSSSSSSTSTFDFNSSINLGALIATDTALIQQEEQFEIASHFTADFSRLEQDPTGTIHDNAQSHNLVQIQNMVGVVNLQCPIDLKEIAMSAKNAEYNPRRFISVILRLRDPRTTALLFRSGKLLITGSRTEHQTRLAARKCARLIQKLGHPNVTFNDFTISNMVGAADLRFPINLRALARMHAQYCEFDPEIFPALVYRATNPAVVILIFVNGKVILTGAKQRSDLYTAFETIYKLLLDFRKGQLISEQPLNESQQSFTTTTLGSSAQWDSYTGSSLIDDDFE